MMSAGYTPLQMGHTHSAATVEAEDKTNTVIRLLTQKKMMKSNMNPSGVILLRVWGQCAYTYWSARRTQTKHPHHASHHNLPRFPVKWTRSTLSINITVGHCCSNWYWMLVNEKDFKLHMKRNLLPQMKISCSFLHAEPVLVMAIFLHRSCIVTWAFCWTQGHQLEVA